MNKKIYAVIVTFNRKQLLKECILALINQKTPCYILIVDNCSTDGTYKFIEQLIDNEQVIYVNTGENLGGAGGFNFGIKEAYNRGADYIWIMDDDCIVHDDTLQKLLDADNKFSGNYGFLSSKVLWKDESICIMNKQKVTLTKWLDNYDINYQKIQMASFVSILIKRDVIKKVGLPIKDFFIWGDDWEYTRRISRQYNCYYISDSVVTHKSKENVGSSIDKIDGDRLKWLQYSYRNNVVLYRDEGWKGNFYIYSRLLYHTLKILKSGKKDKWNRIRLMFESTNEGKHFHPKIEYLN